MSDTNPGDNPQPIIPQGGITEVLSQINIFLKEKCKEINTLNPDLQNYLKKDYMVKEASFYYTNYIKPGLATAGIVLPWYLDWGISALFIPFAADVAVWELKQIGMVE